MSMKKNRNTWMKDCFEQHYDTLMVRGFAYAGRDALLREEVEDCVLEAFEIAWERYDELKDHPSILGWLTQTTYFRLDNISQRAATKMARRAISVEDQAAPEIEDAQAMARLEAWIEKEEDDAVLERILGLLTQNERAVFDAYFVDEQKAADIRRQTGMTIEGIRATIRRIRRKARKHKPTAFFIWVPIIGTLLAFGQIIK